MVENALHANDFFLKKKKNATDFTKLKFQNIKKMNTEQVCRYFKLLQENCDLKIEFRLKHCYVYKREKKIIY